MEPSVVHHRSRPSLTVHFCALALALASVVPVGASGNEAHRNGWPRVHLSNALGRAAVLSSLEGASDWLRDERCQSIFSEFRDLDDGPLVDRLTWLGVDGSAYLRMLFFHDGTDTRQCQSGRIEAFTSAGSRVVFICGREFERLWQANNLRARAVLIHEALHSLGLGENPPSSEEITLRVLKHCARSRG